MMVSRVAALIACMLVSNLANARTSVPQDIQSFIVNADACDHAAGEFDGGLSEQRQQEIEAAVVKYCRPAQKQLKILKVKYKNDARLTDIIRKHAYDSVISFR
jgi:hypothetical protein